MRAGELGRLLWTSVSFALLLTSLLLATFLLIVPKALGALPMAILTGSMRPAMEPGTMVVVKPVPASQLEIGNVVTYQWAPDDPTLVTHRITEISHTSQGQTVLTTQGDNNDAADPPIKAEQVMGEVVYAVPYFGWITNTIHSEVGRQYVRYAAIGFMGYSALNFMSVVVTSFCRRRGQHRASPRDRSYYSDEDSG